MALAGYFGSFDPLGAAVCVGNQRIDGRAFCFIQSHTDAEGLTDRLQVAGDTFQRVSDPLGSVVGPFKHCEQLLEPTHRCFSWEKRGHFQWSSASTPNGAPASLP